ncbi:hypothetical protein [Roseivirga sp.]|uniref:hypothetical protein n=1 Tax=Roseivirga sp. TaxID=1964215 RepID=UPI003B525286
MQKLKLIVCAGLMFLISVAAHGQTELVSGKVFAFKDTPIANLKIKAKKSGETAVTDELGNFTIKCDAKDKLVFQADGFRKEVEKVVAGQRLNVKMILLDGERNSEVAILSGHLSEESLMYATSNFLEYNNDYHTYPDIFALIKGKFPGVKVYEEMGAKRVVIRDIQYFSNENNTALYLVDGVIWQDISILTPMEIKSVNVMKDGAPIGFRGANGVVLITTVDDYGKVDFDNKKGQ